MSPALARSILVDVIRAGHEVRLTAHFRQRVEERRVPVRLVQRALELAEVLDCERDERFRNWKMCVRVSLAEGQTAKISLGVGKDPPTITFITAYWEKRRSVR